MNDPDFDIIVIGGGLAGLTQALMLANKGFNVACIDKDNRGDADARTTAISYGSHKILKKAGIWQDLEPHACPIKDIQILDDTSPVLLGFGVEEIKQETGSEAFGWIIENQIIREKLFAKIKATKNITYLNDTFVTDFNIDHKKATVILNNKESLSAKLVIGADGRQSFTREWMDVGAREWSYNQQAIVTIVTHTQPHSNIAVEHFKSEGPFAILPMLDDENGNHRSSIVWTKHNADALSYDEDSFLAALNNQFPDFFGEVTKTEKRYSFPLSFVHAYSYIKPRMALIADAAHGIHPIAGQGLNIGFRDIDALTGILSAAKEEDKDFGALGILEKYQKARLKDNVAMAAATDLLNTLFANKFPPVQIARKIGLRLVSKVKPAKKFFMRKAMGT